jgi:hypothetical protein
MDSTHFQIKLHIYPYVIIHFPLFQLQCCGVSNYTDWFSCNGWKRHKWVPDSCCIDISKDCGKSKDPNKWQPKGCLEEILYVMQQQYYVLGIVAIVFAAIQILCMVAALVLYSYLKKQHKIKKSG